MRLICPNCDAQYEVPQDAMPQTGREVQCSNCNHTWFQKHPDLVETVPPAPAPPPAAAPARKKLDPAVADILRQEAEHEAKARKAQSSGPLETQPDLGLETRGPEANPAPTPPKETQKSDTKAPVSPPVAAPPPQPAPQTGTLPDIEELTATLAPAAAPVKSASFKRGFWVAVILCAALAAIYLFAANVVQMLPETQNAVQTYVEAIDQARAWVFEQVSAILGMFQ